MSTGYRGPEDKTVFRDHPTEWKAYVDPLPPCQVVTNPSRDPFTSVSTIKNAWPKYLTDWAAKQAAASAWRHREALVSMTEAEALDLVSAAAKRTRDTAANRGTAIHAILERLMDGDDIGGTYDELDPAHPYLGTLRQIVEKLAPVAVASEVVVFGLCGDVAYAGTFDAIWQTSDGLVMVDYKSRQEGKASTRYPEEGAQLGAYASADYWVIQDGDEVRRMEPIEVDAGRIISIAPDAFALYEVDIGQARDSWRRTCEFHETIKTAPQMFARAKVTKTPAEPTVERVAESFGATIHRIAWPDGKPPPPQPEHDDIDEGPLMAGAIDKIKAAVTALGITAEQEAVIAGWVTEGDNSRRPWRITVKETTRRYHLYRASVRLLDFGWTNDGIDGDLVRGLLGLALGEDMQPAATIGAAIGALTVDEAKRLCKIVDAGQIRIDDSGRITAA